MADLLSDTRRLLLPGLWGPQRSNQIHLDIEIDYINDLLMVRGENTDNGKSLAFIITRDEIENGTFKSTFGPNVRTLIEELTYGPIPQGGIW